MPAVMEYDELTKSFAQVFNFVSSERGVITICRGGVPAFRISPINVYRTTDADPALKGEIKCDLFADESSEWESV